MANSVKLSNTIPIGHNFTLLEVSKPKLLTWDFDHVGVVPLFDSGSK